jgi:hypothetical protein
MSLPVVKFKRDENLPVELAEDLRALGHDADTVRDEDLVGAVDPEVVRAALAADRILFTLDKGIANLQRYPIQEHRGRGSISAGQFGARRGPGICGRVTLVGPARIRFR